ncbi:cell division protein [Novosphingobium piscinae]|uniref:Cell division protein n=1 Tax=Novosphingobium piscinae TaxID=1507448 RepID=A0A7X1FXV7_9SPHN|nr:cell division protein [Novosphingobium piscinae]
MSGTQTARRARRAEIVPQDRLQGPIPWVIAIMVGLMVIAAAGALALRNTGQTAASDLAGGITVQIVEARPEVRARLAARAAEVLRRQPGVSEVAIVPPGELAALVEPWLGRVDGAPDDPAGADSGLPVPALIDARLAGPADPARLAALGAALRAEVPAARVDAQSTWLTPVFGAIESLTWLALALIVLLGLATGAAVLLAARTALGNNRATIEIVHLLGGTDAQIAGIFQRATALDAAGGSLAGFAAAWIVVSLLGRTFAALQAGLVTGGALGWGDWALLGLIPLAAVALATLTARWTVMRALKGML